LTLIVSIRLSEHVALTNENRNAERIFMLNLIGKRELQRRRLRWWDDIKMDLKEIRCVAWRGFLWFRRGTSSDLCEHRN